ncbi:MAG: DUF2786 domain-containing protein [Streptomyces sp.]|uniref:DUF2786 domain-containing protein n=1 Tax=Streptomyces sp. TaxID=1931 RepID=UPI003D6AB3BB
MGKHNQERRKAKQKQRRQQAGNRDQRQATAPGGTFGGDGSGFGEGFRDGPSGFVPPPRHSSLADQLELAAREVIEAPEERAALEIDSAASWLASSEQRWPTLSRAVLVTTDRLFGALWRNGWQPADVSRAVRRELKVRHGRLAVDLIASEARRYSVAGLHHRWEAQLNDLEAHPWWGSDEEWLPGFAAREKLDRFGTAICLFEVVRLLSWLPGLEQLCPPPNASASASASATAARPAAPSGGREPRMLGRIRALLEKAESTEFPEEAEAFTAKAQQLMAEHSISEALLAARGGSRDAPACIRLGVDNPYEQPKAVLLNVVADANRCRSVWSKHLGFATVVGFEADLDSVELLYTSLLVQANAALQAESGHGRRPASGGSRTRSFRQSFLLSYATRIGERLTEATSQATDSAVAADAVASPGQADLPGTPGLLPVLAARHEAVEDATERMFPQLTHARSARVSDWEGWTSGRAAADRASLGTDSGALADR